MHLYVTVVYIICTKVLNNILLKLLECQPYCLCCNTRSNKGEPTAALILFYFVLFYFPNAKSIPKIALENNVNSFFL